MWNKPSLELCKSLIMLRDSSISGRLTMKDLPALLNVLLFWKVMQYCAGDSFVPCVDNLEFWIFQAAFQKWDRGRSGKTSSYHLRNMLWESGVGVSNKVLECLVLRFARDAILTSESFIMAMLRLHLAHGTTKFQYLCQWQSHSEANLSMKCLYCNKFTPQSVITHWTRKLNPIRYL